MKVCIVGTSHASCLFAAWINISDKYPNTSISFYFSGGGYFDKFEVDVKKRVLTISDDSIRQRFVQLSGGEGSVNLEDFDICVIVGGFFYLPIGRLAELGDNSSARFSQGVKNSAAIDLFSNIHVAGLIPKIRSISNIPIFLIHDPFQTLESTRPTQEMVNPFEKFDYERGIDLLNNAVLLSQGVRMLLQPSETIEAPYFSKREFALGRRKATQAEIDAGHVGEFVDDNHHLNTTYGELRLKRLFDETQKSHSEFESALSSKAAP